MTSPNQEIEEKLKQIKIKYLKSLPARISEIKSIWDQLNNVQWRIELLPVIQNLIHNISGSGGTFGLPKLSEQAKILEQALNELSNNKNILPSQEKKNEISNLLAMLQAVELSPSAEGEKQEFSQTTNDIIFILDSDKESASQLSKQLINFSCKTRVINDTASLEKNLQKESPLIILLDFDFAEQKIGQRSVIQIIRSDWKKSCPIIFISSRDDFDTRMEAIRYEGNAYFTRPLDMVLLIERIHVLTNINIAAPYQVLIVEDDQELANYYAVVLESGGMKSYVEPKPELALTKILQLNPELILMNLYMPNYNGLDIIKLIRQHQLFLTLPIILLTSASDEDLKPSLYELGVDDLLLKPINEKNLLASVLNRAQRSRYMNTSVARDNLTGLFAHKNTNEYLETQLNICKRYKRTLSYAVINLDNFKSINDTYGHLIGDNVLIAVANLLKTNVRMTDFVGRYGSDEFVIVFPETSEKYTQETLERIREEFAKMPHYADGKTFYSSFSAGITNYPVSEDANSIIASAEKALSHSKNNGRNCITIWDKHLNITG